MSAEHECLPRWVENTIAGIVPIVLIAAFLSRWWPEQTAMSVGAYSIFTLAVMVQVVIADRRYHRENPRVFGQDLDTYPRDMNER